MLSIFLVTMFILYNAFSLVYLIGFKYVPLI